MHYSVHYVFNLHADPFLTNSCIMYVVKRMCASNTCPLFPTCNVFHMIVLILSLHVALMTHSRALSVHSQVHNPQCYNFLTGVAGVSYSN